MNNKSSIYGYYGGVTEENHYVPPESPNFIPHPSKNNIFTEEDRAQLQQLLDQTQFYVDNAPNILLRVNTLSLSGNIDTFVMSTSAKPEDVVIYTANQDQFILNIWVIDGGSF